jgi:hypothetical protein
LKFKDVDRSGISESERTAILSSRAALVPIAMTDFSDNAIGALEQQQTHPLPPKWSSSFSSTSEGIHAEPKAVAKSRSPNIQAPRQLARNLAGGTMGKKL